MSAIKLAQRHRNDAIVRMRSEGADQNEIAAAFGLTHQRVSQILAAARVA